MATPPEKIVVTIPTIQKRTTSSWLGGPSFFEFAGERRGIPQSLPAARVTIYQDAAAIWLPTCHTPRAKILGRLHRAAYSPAPRPEPGMALCDHPRLPRMVDEACSRIRFMRLRMAGSRRQTRANGESGT
jgi:hypothetical protein